MTNTEETYAPGCACHRYLAHEDAYPDLDAEGAVGRLSAAIRCATVNTDPAQTDFSQFERLHQLMRESYPHVMAAGTFEVIGQSVLITIPGSDASLDPILLMAHEDVVPVVEGTEDAWTHPPFSGTVDDTYIWGRGSMDIKLMVTGELEAAEYALAHGGKLKRTLFLAFGEDEETYGTGAQAIAATLAERGQHLAFLLDESVSVVRDMGLYGAPGTLAIEAALAEKGYVNIEITAPSAGGHSSNPFHGTSLGTLARAIARIEDAAFPGELTRTTLDLLKRLSPFITKEPWRSLVGADGSEVERNAEALAELFLVDEKLFPYATTTCAPTMVAGGAQAANVMPGDMRAIVNFRTMPGTTAADVLARCEDACRSLPVTLRIEQGIEASATARTDGYGFNTVSHVSERFFADTRDGSPVLVLPSFTVGGTDAGYYDAVCDTCLRMSPFLLDDDEQARGVHGTDERVTKRAYLHGIRFLIALIEECCL